MIVVTRIGVTESEIDHIRERVEEAIGYLDLTGGQAEVSVEGATVVVGTNGTRLTDDRIRSLMEAGVSGVAISIDSLDPRYHDRFRHGGGALRDTLAAVDKYGIAGDVSYISTGGGAFLEFLEGKKLPAVAILEERAATAIDARQA